MRNWILLTGLLLAVLLPACSPLKFEDYPDSTAVAAPTDELEATAEAPADGDTDEVPDLNPHLELLIGTFRLAGTDQEVTAPQAEELIPLWMTIKTTLANMLFRVEDVNAVTASIQAVMTPAQRSAIDAMDLTYQDMFDLMEEWNLTLGQYGLSDDPDDYFPDQDDHPADNEETPQPDGDEIPGFQGGGWEHWSQMIPPGMVDKLVEYLRGV
jgi:hypothetical protein